KPRAEISRRAIGETRRSGRGRNVTGWGDLGMDCASCGRQRQDVLGRPLAVAARRTDNSKERPADEGARPEAGTSAHLGPIRAVHARTREEIERMNRCKILVADDEKPVAAGLQGQLEALGYDVVAVVDDGHRAIEVCRRTLPDVVLMDIEMPGLDG